MNGRGTGEVEVLQGAPPDRKYRRFVVTAKHMNVMSRPSP